MAFTVESLASTEGVMRGVALVGVACLTFLVACSKPSSILEAPSSGQSPIPLPGDGLEPQPLENLENPFVPGDKLDISKVYMRVRLFPILSAPAGEPYPITKNKYLVEIQNPSGFEVWYDNHQIDNAKKIHFDFKNKVVSLYESTLAKTPKHKINLQKLWLFPSQNPTRVYFDQGAVDLTYRGFFRVETTKFGVNSNWSLINFLDIEDYLLAVVPSEVPTSWHMEALKSQAIAARTYGLRQLVLARNAKRNWDVDPTTQFQSYRGYQKEHPRVTKAVKETKDQIITYKNGVIEASYSSNSGGITCSAKECFGSKDIDYLISKTDDIEMDVRNVPPVGTWKACLSPELTQFHLARYEYMGALAPTFSTPSTSGKPAIEVCADKDFKEQVHHELDHRIRVRHVAADFTSSTGRVWSFRVQFENGKFVTLKSSESLDSQTGTKVPSLRSVVVGRRSHLFSLSPKGDHGIQEITGHGFGHGVGMSQFGAQLRAEKYKLTALEILKFYYHGTRVQKIRDLKKVIPASLSVETIATN